LTYAAIDFERQTLAAGLEQSGFNPKLPAFFSWLGVVPYLTREPCSDPGLHCENAFGRGVVFDFAVNPKLLGWPERVALYALSRRVAAAGEPFQCSFARWDSLRNSKIWDFGVPRYWERRKSMSVISPIARMDYASAVAPDGLWARGFDVSVAKDRSPVKFS
jgi:O-methyltransferase involved in polyketide biosynthesis